MFLHGRERNSSFWMERAGGVLGAVNRRGVGVVGMRGLRSRVFVNTWRAFALYLPAVFLFALYMWAGGAAGERAGNDA